MILELACAVMLAVPQESPSPAPPFTIVAVARTKALDPKIVPAFKVRVKEIETYARILSRVPAAVDKEAGWEEWRFEVPGTVKFDPNRFSALYSEIKVHKCLLTMSGTATQDPQTKVIFLTAAGEKAKAKLMNRPKDVWKPEETPEDTVGRLSKAMERGVREFEVTGQIFSHGGTFALLVESFQQLSGPPDPEPVKEPVQPYQVIVTAKTRFARGKETYQDFRNRVEKVRSFCRLVGEGMGIPGDNAGWEVWTFEVSGDVKFDMNFFPRLFGDMKCSKYELEFSGEATQDPKTKIIFVTAVGDKLKVKLMNKPKKDVRDTVDDQVAQVSEAIAKGKTRFRVRGEIFSHGGTLAILLDSFSAESGPKK